MAYKSWHNIIQSDLEQLATFIEYFEKEINDARNEFQNLSKQLIVTIEDKMPIYFEKRYGQLQEVESVMQIIELKEKEIYTEAYKKYLEHYNKALSSTDCSRYADGDKSVIAIREIKVEVAHIRNQLLGITKAYEMKHFALGNVIKLRCAGLEDARM